MDGRLTEATGGSPCSRACSTSRSKPSPYGYFVTTERRADVDRGHLGALLESKPPADEVPLEASRHLAESLQHASGDRSARHVRRCGRSRHCPCPCPCGRRSAISRVVSARPTQLEKLRGAVLDHLDALDCPDGGDAAGHEGGHARVTDPGTKPGGDVTGFSRSRRPVRAESQAGQRPRALRSVG
jgi:hypothetical protein